MQEHDTTGNPWASIGGRMYELSETMIMAFGLSEALFLEQIRQGIEGLSPMYKYFDDRAYFDNRYWVFLDRDTILSDYPWLSKDDLARMLDKLKEGGVLLSCIPENLFEIQDDLEAQGCEPYDDPRLYSLNYDAVTPFILHSPTAWPGRKAYGHE